MTDIKSIFPTGEDKDRDYGPSAIFVVQQSVLIHPDWTSEDHLSYLVNDEFFSTAQAIGAVAWAVKNGWIAHE